jgi:hypothetical protein
VPYSASRAAGEPPAPGAKVFTENVRHLGSFIEKRPVSSIYNQFVGLKEEEGLVRDDKRRYIHCKTSFRYSV